MIHLVYDGESQNTLLVYYTAAGKKSRPTVVRKNKQLHLLLFLLLRDRERESKRETERLRERQREEREGAIKMSEGKQ